MSQTFSFGFSGDDIEDSEACEGDSRKARVENNNLQSKPGEEITPSLIPQKHSLHELLASLPSQLSYRTLEISLQDDSKIKIPRRELFDVRIQLMAEDDEPEAPARANSTAGPMLGQDDIKTSIYEGGLKSWECALDLVTLLASEEAYFQNSGKEDEIAYVLELGCGTALPTLCLFQRALLHDYRNIRFTLADYNVDVLRLVTLPNLLLSWMMICRGPWALESDVEITHEVLEEFMMDMERKELTVDAISGPWGEEFMNLASPLPRKQDNLLVLASETIYSPDVLPAFVKLLHDTLQEVPRAKALIAAKKMYFGVGGGVEDFISEFKRLGGEGAVTTQVMEVNDPGVARVVLEACIHH